MATGQRGTSDRRATPDRAGAHVALTPVRDAWGKVEDFTFDGLDEAAAEWIGLPAGMVVGRTMRQIFSRDEIAGLLPPLMVVLDTGEPWVDTDRLTPDGTHRFALEAVTAGDRILIAFRPLSLTGSGGPGDAAPEVEALRRLAGAIAAGHSRDVVLALAGELLSELFGADDVIVARGPAGSEEFVSTNLTPIRGLPLGDSPLGRSLRDGVPVRCDDLALIDDPAVAWLRSHGLTAALAVPIRVDGHAAGGMAFAARTPAPAHAEAVLETIATLIGVMLRDHDEAAGRRGTLDPLTGLPGHEGFRDALADAWEDALRRSAPLSLAVFDVDHLAAVNDRLGPATGDAVLAAVSGRLRARLGARGALARIGGEEFACLLPGLGVAEALDLADALRAAVSADTVPGVGEVTISGGVASMEQAARPAELLRLAEGAVSWAKTHGRDLVLPYDAEVVEAFSAADWAERLDRDRTMGSIEALARAVDARDRTTQEHSERVAHAASALATELGWSPGRVALLREAARVHDVGKVAVPDAVLHKRGPFTERERERMRTHSQRGAEIVAGVLSEEQVAWVLHHHERWDGAGYPGGLVADAIPEGARILAIVDAMDAMTSDRPYRPGRPRDEALAEIWRASGTQLWPAGVDAYLRTHSVAAEGPGDATALGKSP